MIPHGIHDHEEADYHADPALGSGDIANLCRSAVTYRYYADNPKPQTDAMAFGSLVHSMVLEPETVQHRYVQQPAEIKVRRGKKWDAFLEENEGKTIVKEADIARARDVRDAVLGEPAVARLLTSGQTEVSLRWDDQATGTPCKGRVDSLPEGGTITLPGENGELDRFHLADCAVDLKTTSDASPAYWCGRNLERYGYHTQGAHYLRGLAACGSPRTVWIWVVVESAHPIHVGVYVMQRQTQREGDALCAAAYRRYAVCRETGLWPGYSTEPRYVGLTEWGVAAAQQQAEAMQNQADELAAENVGF